jgi:hypothetical protein
MDWCDLDAYSEKFIACEAVAMDKQTISEYFQSDFKPFYDQLLGKSKSCGDGQHMNPGTT